MALPSAWPRRSFQSRRWPSNIDDFLGSFLSDWYTAEGTTSSFPVDVEEREAEYIVYANMPGVRREDIDISFEDNVLSVTAKIGADQEEKGRNFLHRERWNGVMTRSITLPAAADYENIEAKLRDGVLVVRVKKRHEKQQKKIAIG